MPSFEIGLSVSSIEKDYNHKTRRTLKLLSYVLCVFVIGGELLDFDFNVRTVDANVIPRHSTARRWAEHFSSGHVKNASVPGAGHFHATQFTFAKRAAHVGTGVVDRVKRAADVEERDLLTVDFDHPGLSSRNVVGLGNFYKLWHWVLSKYLANRIIVLFVPS